MVLGRVLHDGIFGTLNFRFEFKTANQPGFEPGSPGHKAAKLTIKLHSIARTMKKFTKYYSKHFMSQDCTMLKL